MLKSREPLRRRLQNPVVFLLACALGIPGGWLAWRLHRTQPIPAARPVLDWSKPDFIADANADKVRAELEAARQRAEAARPFVIEASKADKEQLQSLMTAYSTGLKPVREPPLLDLTTVIQVEQLRQKKQTVQTFITANEALRTFLARREENYRETLLKLGLPGESLDSVMEAYHKTAAQPTALALKMRNDDNKMGTALLGMLDVLDAHWGQWKFNRANQRVEFSEHAAQEKFLDLKEALDQASLEQMACQIKLAALETSE